MGDPATDTENFLDLSDEDFAKLQEPDFDSSGSDEEETPEEESETPPEEKDPKPEEDAQDEGGEEPTETGGSEEASTEGKEEETDPATEEVPADKDTAEDEKAAEEVIDYEAKYKALMAPFKANGTTITPKSPEEMQQFAQMGANYHKKMAGMAPARKALKVLENNGLLDEGKLDFLIDVSKGDPDAINKLLKENKIDPLDVDVNAESTYTPTTHTVSDSELALDEVLADIQNSPSYSKTLDAVTNNWDDTSRNEAAANPHIIKVINEHMDSGVYDKVMGAVSYERSLGRLKGVSDFEAYKAMGNKLEAEGTLPSQANPKKATVDPVTSTATKVDPAAEQRRKARKKAASPTKTTSKVGGLPKDFNPLDMSDEEFEKFDPKLIGL